MSLPMPGARWLVVRGRHTAARVALPALGAFTLGSDPGADLAIDEEGVAARHAVVRLHPEVEVELLEGDAALVSRGADDERLLGAGATLALGLEQTLRLGSVEVALLAVEECPRPRHALERSTFLGRVDALLGAAPTARGVFAHLRVPTARDAEALEAFVAERLEPGDLLGALEPDELAIVFASPRGASEARLRDLEAAITRELGAGDCELGFVDASGGGAADLLERARAAGRAEAKSHDDEVPIVAESPGMRGVLARVAEVGPTDGAVLVLGETGTGKDLVARRVHAASARAAKGLVLAAAHELEAPGEEGATLAQLFARADGGTVLVDEVGALPARLQVSLGQLMDARDVRVIATSNHDLRTDVRQGSFRKDLFFRLSRATIVIPPLRERIEDILPLAERALDDLARTSGRRVTLTDAAKARLLGHPWPGNTRELHHVLERAHLGARDEAIDADDLVLEDLDEPASSPREPAPSAASLREELDAIERRRILDALAQAPTQAEAAKTLGIPLRTFLDRLDALGIPRPRKGKRSSS